MVDNNNLHPKVFISYSWDNKENQLWVADFSKRLRGDGVDVTLDQWHTAPGDQLPAFMERSIRCNDFILIVCTPTYKMKSDERKGGVGYEGDIITAEVLMKGNHRKFIPILRIGDWQNAAPVWLLGKYYLDFRGEPYKDSVYVELLDILYGTRAGLPVLGISRKKEMATVKRFSLLRDLSADDLIGLGKSNNSVKKKK